MRTLEYQSDGYHVVLVFNSTKVLEMFMMTIIILVMAIMVLFLAKWFISLTSCILWQEGHRKPDLIHIKSDPALHSFSLGLQGRLGVWFYGAGENSAHFVPPPWTFDQRGWWNQTRVMNGYNSLFWLENTQQTKMQLVISIGVSALTFPNQDKSQISFDYPVNE